MPSASATPSVAPADCALREPSHERDDFSVVRTGGPGWPTTLACFGCQNTEGNLQIWHSWWVSRNGDATSNDEIRCARCGLFSLYITEH